MTDRVAFVLVILISLTSITSFAGATKAGDGGHFIACVASQPTFLDVAEAKALFGFEPFLEVGHRNRPFDSFESLAEVAINRVRSYAPARFSKHLEEELRALKISIQDFRTSKTQPLTFDYGPYFVEIPESCYVRQIAIRSPSDSTQLMVDFDHFRDLPATDQGALLLHEALHPWFGKRPSTIAVRQAVWFIVSPEEFRNQNKLLFKELLTRKRPIDVRRFTR